MRIFCSFSILPVYLCRIYFSVFFTACFLSTYLEEEKGTGCRKSYSSEMLAVGSPDSGKWSIYINLLPEDTVNLLSVSLYYRAHDIYPINICVKCAENAQLCCSDYNSYPQSGTGKVRVAGDLSSTEEQCHGNEPRDSRQ